MSTVDREFRVNVPPRGITDDGTGELHLESRYVRRAGPPTDDLTGRFRGYSTTIPLPPIDASTHVCQRTRTKWEEGGRESWGGAELPQICTPVVTKFYRGKYPELWDCWKEPSEEGRITREGTEFSDAAACRLIETLYPGFWNSPNAHPGAHWCFKEDHKYSKYRMVIRPSGRKYIETDREGAISWNATLLGRFREHMVETRRCLAEGGTWHWRNSYGRPSLSGPRYTRPKSDPAKTTERTP